MNSRPRVLARGLFDRKATIYRRWAGKEALVWYRLLFTGKPLDREFVEDTVDRFLLPLFRSWSGQES
ncbi:hypothetical protein [Streptosporangium sp. NPDC001681]|uniref:hypothetical protein n=1 Tax=Streptosporangium sp. NPDC001681 TaxID=3154395 RepID=UPI003331E4C0